MLFNLSIHIIIYTAFSVELAQECKFVFLAVSGDFALANAKNITANGTTVGKNISTCVYA